MDPGFQGGRIASEYKLSRFHMATQVITGLL